MQAAFIRVIKPEIQTQKNGQVNTWPKIQTWRVLPQSYQSTKTIKWFADVYSLELKLHCHNDLNQLRT
jgi:hypothetical protein